MTHKPTELDDIAESIQDLATMVGQQFEVVNQRFEQVDQRFDKMDQRFEQIDQRFGHVDQRFDRIEATLGDMQIEQCEMRAWLERIDSRLSGVESDITEIYDRIVVLEQKSRKKPLSLSDKKELGHKLEALIGWAEEVSKQTGIALPKL